MNKYGIEHFHVSLIEETSNPDERERYWIEQYKSFKYGYNATIGGDGKRYLDYDLILKTYSKTNNCAETARILNISPDSVRKVLQSYHIEIKDSYSVLKEKCSKIVGMYDLSSQQLVKVFSSVTEAAKYL